MCEDHLSTYYSPIHLLAYHYGYGEETTKKLRCWLEELSIDNNNVMKKKERESIEGGSEEN